jgi:hypothetical protein
MRTSVLWRVGGGMAPWSVPDHLRKPRSSGDPKRAADASDIPVWVEADEVRAFRAWWETLPEAQRNARRAFSRGLERADAAWSDVYKSQRTLLEDAQRSLRASDQDLTRLRTENKELRAQLDQAIDRACEAEERVSLLTTPLAREYD